MIISRLLGGLGNQLFQYALGRAMALRHRTELSLDTSWFTAERLAEETPRLYALNSLRIDAEILPPELSGHPANTAFGETFSLRSGQSIESYVYFCQRTNSFDPSILEAPPNAYFDGFWQSEGYFSDASRAIREDLVLKFGLSPTRQEIERMILSRQSVSVHVRRGDYVSNPVAASHLGALPRDWYAAAIELMAKRFPAAQFFVFSDDIDWCRHNLSLPLGTFFVDPLPKSDDFEEIYLMSKCSHHIIANSSFSWWGAWLNHRQDKVVIAPHRWTLSGIDAADMLCDGWIAL